MRCLLSIIQGSCKSLWLILWRVLKTSVSMCHRRNYEALGAKKILMTKIFTAKELAKPGSKCQQLSGSQTWRTISAIELHIR